MGPAGEISRERIVTRCTVKEDERRSSIRILLAEDNPVNPKVAVRILERFTWRTDVVSNGREAVAAWQRGSYNLILTHNSSPYSHHRHDGQRYDGRPGEMPGSWNG